MKKAVLFLVLLSVASMASAQTPSCTSITVSLSRGAESASVLSLQNFLFAKGILKVTPNGYFGPSTYAAVKAYQKVRGLSQVGIVGPATRAAIKQESCNGSATPSLPAATVPQAPTPSPTPTVTVTASVPTLPRPRIDSFDLVTLFAGGTANWNFAMYGSNFSTSSNVVTFRNTETRKIYTIGTLPSSAMGTLTLPTNLTGIDYPCGTGCKEKMEAGRYEVTITTPGGTSDPKALTIQPFTMSAQTTAVNTVQASATGIQLGTFSFSTSQAVVMKDIFFTLATSTISGGGLNTITIKDMITGGSLDGNTELQAVQSGFVGVYANVNNTKAGDASGYFTVTIQDYIGNHETTFVSRPILVTVAGVI